MQELQMAAVAGDTARTCQFEYDVLQVTWATLMSTADSVAIGSIVKMQKRLLHCYVHLLQKVKRLDRETVQKPAAGGAWICPVCSHPFHDRDTLKGHVRYSEIYAAIFSVTFYSDNWRCRSQYLRIGPASVVYQYQIPNMFIWCDALQGLPLKLRLNISAFCFTVVCSCIAGSKYLQTMLWELLNHG
jgi:hypothetical protein